MEVIFNVCEKNSYLHVSETLIEANERDREPIDTNGSKTANTVKKEG
jgi:hypothetical protein